MTFVRNTELPFPLLLCYNNHNSYTKGRIKLETKQGVPYPMVRANQWTILACVVLSWGTDNFSWLLIPLLAGLSGLLTGFNPILHATRLFLRKPMAAYVREDLGQLRFNQSIAVILLTFGFIGYSSHAMLLADICTALVAVASGVAIAGFCVGCFIRYQWRQYRYRRSL